MDPLTTAAGALTVSKVALAVSRSIYSFIQGAKEVNESVRRLQYRASSVSQNLENLGRTLEKPQSLLRVKDNHELFTAVDDSVDSCRATILRLQTKLGVVESSKVGIKKAWKYAAMGLMQTEIDSILSELNTHDINLQFSLQMINVAVSTASGVAVASVQFHVEKLERMIIALDTRLKPQSPQQTQTVDSLPSDILLDNNTTSLMHTAESIISSASTAAIGSEIGTLRIHDIAEEVAVDVGIEKTGRRLHGSQEPVFRHLSQRHDLEIPEESTSGSELGRPLDRAVKQRIQFWIPDPPPNIDERSELDSSSSRNQEQDSIFTSSGLRREVNSSGSTSASLNDNLDEDEGSEEDGGVEFQVAQRLSAKSKVRFAEGQYGEALELIKISLSHAQNFSAKRKEELGLRDMHLHLAMCYLRTGAVEPAEEVLLAAAKEPVVGEKGKERVLCAYHNLSILNLKKGKIEAAESLCRQALSGRGKLNSVGQNHEDYIQSLRLRAIISWAKGDKHTAEAYGELLPQDRRLTVPDFERILEEYKAWPISKGERHNPLETLSSMSLSLSSQGSSAAQVEPSQPDNSHGQTHVDIPRPVSLTETQSKSAAEDTASSTLDHASSSTVSYTEGIWRTGAANMRRLKLRSHLRNSIRTMELSRDGKYIGVMYTLAKLSDFLLLTYDADNGEEGFTDKTRLANCSSMCFSPQNSRILAYGRQEWNWRVILLDIIRDTNRMRFPKTFSAINFIKFSPDGNLLACAYYGGSIQIWSTNTGDLIHDLKKERYGADTITAMMFSPDGRILAVAGYNRHQATIYNQRLMDTEFKRQMVSYAPGERITGMSWSADGRLIAWTTAIGKMVICSITNGSVDANTVLQWEIEPCASRQHLCFSNSGKLWDTKQGILLAKNMDPWNGDIRLLRFAPDDKCLLCGDSRGVIRLWDIGDEERGYKLE